MHENTDAIGGKVQYQSVHKERVDGCRMVAYDFLRFSHRGSLLGVILLELLVPVKRGKGDAALESYIMQLKHDRRG